MGEPFLEQLCDMGGFEGGTWADYIKCNNPEDIQLCERRGMVYLAGMWGSVLEEAVKAEFKAVDNACGDVIDLLMQYGNEEDHGKPAERTEKKTRKWLEQGKANRLPVWDPEDDWDSDDSDW